MFKFTLTVLAVFVVSLNVRCLADSLDDAQHRNWENEDHQLDNELDRSSMGRGQAPAVSGGQPNQLGAYPRMFPECYVCTDCPQVSANTTSKVCPRSNDRSKNNKCVVYSEKYIHMKRTWHIRGCASERGSCADIKKAHEQHEHIVRLENCVECEGDRCNTNGVSRSVPDLIMAFIVLVITPVLGKLTLT